ncbi:hypothetical protein BKA93DRAFT_26402 [Sparassis latifolia]
MPFPAQLTACSGADRIYDVRLQIGSEIKRHNNYVRSLHSLPKSTALPPRLAPELLCRIFFFAVYADGRPDLYGWIALSQVCHVWRNIALNYSVLWVYVPMHKPQWTVEVLSRTKNTDLTVRVDLSQKFSLASFHSLQTDHFLRVRELHVFALKRETYGEFVDMLPVDAPHLECLSIIFDSGVDDDDSDEDEVEEEDVLLLPHSVFRNAPMLRCLYLRGLLWDSLLFPHLAHLAIHELAEGFLEMSPLLSILESLPQLLSLSLISVITIDSSLDSETSARVVHLPSLRLLHLDEDSDFFIVFMSSIDLPPDVVMRITVRPMWSASAEIRNVVDAITPHVNGSINNRRIQAILFDFDVREACGVQVSGWAPEHSNGGLSHLPPTVPPLYMRVLWKNDDVVVPVIQIRLAEAFCNAFNLAGVSDVQLNPGNTALYLWDVPPLAYRVTRICISETHASGMLGHFYDTALGKDSPFRDIVSGDFCRLRALTLTRCHDDSEMFCIRDQSLPSSNSYK